MFFFRFLLFLYKVFTTKFTQTLRIFCVYLGLFFSCCDKFCNKYTKLSAILLLIECNCTVCVFECVCECVSTLQKQLTIFLLQLNIQIIDCSPIWSRSLSFFISFSDRITPPYMLCQSVSVCECVCLQFGVCVFINKLHYIYRIYIYINIYSMHSLCFSKLSSSTLLTFFLPSSFSSSTLLHPKSKN